jgi:hypothetical protein
VGVAGESGAADAPGGRVADRGRLLESDLDAAARGVFDGLFGLVGEVVVRQAVMERSQGVRCLGARRGAWGGCVQRTKEGMRSLSGNVQGREGKRSQRCQRALTEKQTLLGGGAPQVGDLRLLEDGGEGGGALVSDPVSSEPASEGCCGLWGW